MVKVRNRYKTAKVKKRRFLSALRTLLPICLLVLVVSLLSAAFAHSYYALLDASWPEIKEIQINGLNYIDRKEVLNTLAIPKGANLFTLRAAQLARQLESLPRLRSVVVHLDLAGRVVVDVIEREPLAVVHTDDFYLLDAQGKLFINVQPAKHQNLLLVTGLSDSDLSGPDILQGEPLDALKHLLAALEKVRDWFPFQHISECHWNGADGFTLYTTQGGIPIRLGLEDYEGKLARLNRVFRVLMDRQWLDEVSRIDMDYPDRAYIEGRFPIPKGI
jgi:cell division protein FtsQ